MDIKCVIERVESKNINNCILAYFNGAKKTCLKYLIVIYDVNNE